PSVTMLHDATLDRLIAFAQTGGKIIAIGSNRLETTKSRQISIDSIPNAITIQSANDLPAVLKNIDQFVQSALPTLHKRDGDLNILFVPAVAGMATVVKWAA